SRRRGALSERGGQIRLRQDGPFRSGCTWNIRWRRLKGYTSVLSPLRSSLDADVTLAGDEICLRGSHWNSDRLTPQGLLDRRLQRLLVSHRGLDIHRMTWGGVVLEVLGVRRGQQGFPVRRTHVKVGQSPEGRPSENVDRPGLHVPGVVLRGELLVAI